MLKRSDEDSLGDRWILPTGSWNNQGHFFQRGPQATVSQILFGFVHPEQAKKIQEAGMTPVSRASWLFIWSGEH